jgi:EAL domain-containing protein (putative c-di-GMP-specific phosphodiesterase class I)
VALCHGLGLQVVAEGVERPAQLDFLMRCGPIGVQGYLLARPVDASATAAEAQEAGIRGRQAMEEVARTVQPESAESLVFLGGGTRRRGP